jgi:uncharacterized membrane protein (UPF0127 family)
MLHPALLAIFAALLIGPQNTRLSGQEQLPPPGQAWVIFGADTVQAEVARTPEERERGLMYRESLAKGTGMLFVFPEAQYRSFWMKDTFIPLDIAFLDADLRIVDILPMEPRDTDPTASSRPAMFALEVPRGWFAEEGIAVGVQARLVFGPGGSWDPRANTGPSTLKG